MIKVYQGDARAVLKTLPDESVNCIVTSPPYWGLRKYGAGPHEIGQEPTPEKYIAALMDVFTDTWRILRGDGTLWIVIDDTAANGNKGDGRRDRPWHKQWSNKGTNQGPGPNRSSDCIIPPKSLCAIPARLQLAMIGAGWLLRCDAIWFKPNTMPESVKDRPTRAHEYVLMFSKHQRYYYDAASVEEMQSQDERARRLREHQNGLSTKYNLVRDREHGQVQPGQKGCARSVAARQALAIKGTRNRRSVWFIPNTPSHGKHFAQFPMELAAICIMAGCPHGGIVLDPFAGSGTTGEIAVGLGRDAILIELKQGYIPLIQERCGLFHEVVA